MELQAAPTVTVALTTVPDVQTAETIARTLVDEGLAACVNIVPGVRSIYRWQGQLQDERELICIIKTATDRLPALAARLRELHPYEVPELLAGPPQAGAVAYLAWVLESTRPR